MNILGISGAIGWDGNEPTTEWIAERTGSDEGIRARRGAVGKTGDYWVHGSGATLIMDGELKNSMCEERFSRIKFDGNYPVLAIEKILDHNKLTKYDIDLVVYVGTATQDYRMQRQSGLLEKKIQEYFPKCKVELFSHHLAHAAATFYTSGFDEANVLTFDGAGDSEASQNGRPKIPHMKFSQGKGLTLTEVHTEYYSIPPMYESFGHLYGKYSLFAYKIKMNLSKEMCPQSLVEKLPGKVMGLAAFGDYRNVFLPEWFIKDTTQKRLVKPGESGEIQVDLDTSKLYRDVRQDIFVQFEPIKELIKLTIMGKVFKEEDLAHLKKD